MTETLCTAAMVSFMAGSNAPSISAGEATILINRAEGVIATTTRYDWVANYAAMGANTKKILEEAAAAYAAIDQIKYNASSYDSLKEAELMMNGNWTKYKECIKLLKDKVETDWLKQQTT